MSRIALLRTADQGPKGTLREFYTFPTSPLFIQALASVVEETLTRARALEVAR